LIRVDEKSRKEGGGIIENASRVDVEVEVEVFGVWVEGEEGGETEGDAAEGEEGGETEAAAAAAAAAATETGRPCGREKGGCYSAGTENTHKKHTSGLLRCPEHTW
jgi:hypothetical protein